MHASMAAERARLQEDEALLGRVRELVQSRGAERDPGVRQLGDVSIDLPRNEVSVGDTPVHLTQSEYRLLVLLGERPGCVYGRPEIVSRLWSSRHVGSTRSCDSHVVRLRQKLAAAGAERCRIATVRGVGYRLDVV